MPRRKRPVIRARRALPEKNPGMPDPSMVRAAVLEAVNDQLSDNNPPEVRATYERLRAEGHSDEEARRLIGMVLTTEMWHVLNKQTPYNHERYVAARDGSRHRSDSPV